MQPIVMDLGSMGSYQEVRSRRDAINLEEEAAIKCSAPYRAPELTQVFTFYNHYYYYIIIIIILLF